MEEDSDGAEVGVGSAECIEVDAESKEVLSKICALLYKFESQQRNRIAKHIIRISHDKTLCLLGSKRR